MLINILINKGLTPRQAKITRLAVKGYSNKEIGDQLLITEKTVRAHLVNIYRTMNVNSRAQLIVWCLPHMAFESNPALTAN